MISDASKLCVLVFYWNKNVLQKHSNDCSNKLVPFSYTKQYIAMKSDKHLKHAYLKVKYVN